MSEGHQGIGRPSRSPLEMGDVYDSLRRNVIEGVTVDLSTLKYWKFADVTKYVTADWQLWNRIYLLFRDEQE